MNIIEFMKVSSALYESLRTIQQQVIGMFNPKWTNEGSDYLCVLSEDRDGMLFAINIGNLLGLQTLTIHKDNGKYVKFPDGKTLWDMMDDPIELVAWWEKNF